MLGYFLIMKWAGQRGFQKPYYLDEKLKDLDYLSEGILEELLSLISSNPNVKTTSRTTSLYLK
jgi:hypothetical protein